MENDKTIAVADVVEVVTSVMVEGRGETSIFSC